jgi:phage anti-repressor protein
MDLRIMTSKKGTNVVTTSNLHQALKLPEHQYVRNVNKWLSDFYAFRDDVRKPVELLDFARRELKLSKLQDFYISIEMARLITLNSDSEVKQKYARYLQSLDEKGRDAELMSKEQVMAVIELTKVMGLYSCQQNAEKIHLKQFEDNNGYNFRWWQYRAKLLGYSVSELREKMSEIGNNFQGKNLRMMLLQLDKYEVIRIAVIDLFVALGRSEAFARNMGDLAKFLARELKVEIWDDRNTSIPFHTTDVNMELANKVRTMDAGRPVLPLAI